MYLQYFNYDSEQPYKTAKITKFPSKSKNWQGRNITVEKIDDLTEFKNLKIETLLYTVDTSFISADVQIGQQIIRIATEVKQYIVEDYISDFGIAKGGYIYADYNFIYSEIGFYPMSENCNVYKNLLVEYKKEQAKKELTAKPVSKKITKAKINNFTTYMDIEGNTHHIVGVVTPNKEYKKRLYLCIQKHKEYLTKDEIINKVTNLEYTLENNLKLVSEVSPFVLDSSDFTLQDVINSYNSNLQNIQKSNLKALVNYNPHIWSVVSYTYRYDNMYSKLLNHVESKQAFRELYPNIPEDFTLFAHYLDKYSEEEIKDLMVETINNPVNANATLVDKHIDYQSLSFKDYVQVVTLSMMDFTLKNILSVKPLKSEIVNNLELYNVDNLYESLKVILYYIENNLYFGYNSGLNMYGVVSKVKVNRNIIGLYFTPKYINYEGNYATSMGERELSLSKLNYKYLIKNLNENQF